MSVGIIGVLCDLRTAEKVLQPKGITGKPKPAKCNRWSGHDEPHRMTDVKTFELLWEWPNEECEVPDWKTERRREMALAKAKGEK